jgi:hypothetical protein
MDSLLKRIDKEWRKILRRNAVLSSLALSLLLGALALRTLSETDALTMTATSLVIFFAFFREKYQTTTTQLICELNRRPELEHSAELLLNAPDDLPFLARLQRRKVAEWLEKQDVKRVLPNEWRKRLLWLGASATLSTLIIIIPKTPSKPIYSSEPPTETSASQLTIASVEVQIAPPAYTLKPTHIQSSLNIIAEEQSQICWRVKLTRECEQVILTTISGDTICFKHESERTYRAEMKVNQSELYTLNIDTLISKIGTIEVQKDLPPVVSVITPDARTEFSSPDSARLFIKATISDDYKIRKVNLVVTTAKGKGEAVKFKSDTLRLYANSILENRIEQYETKLDLKSYGLTYGDELYFFIEAFDNREPKSHRTQSETYVAKILDTLQSASSESIAMPVLRLPAYFRSQRQLIIDTEKLIAEKKSLEPLAFRTRSENLGVDQKVLRLRYGKFLGEELAISIGESENERLSKTMRDTSSNPIIKLQNQALKRAPKIDDGHNHNEQTPPTQSVEALAEPYMHRHDLEEAATFFSEPIKQKLKATLAQMWEAEKFLRLVEPERALPHEYKALQLLKELQQEARIYVEKSGFEPTPIDETRLRLTGDNAKIQSIRNVERHSQKDSLEVMKRTLALLSEMPKKLSNNETHLIEEAGKQVAQIALEGDYKRLSALGAFRELISEARSGQVPTEKNVRLLQRVLSDILPLPMQFANQRKSSSSRVMERYVQSLNEKP